MGLGTILFLIFLVLKLTQNIDWSWFWVVSPMIIEFVIGFSALLVLMSRKSESKKAFESRNRF